MIAPCSALQILQNVWNTLNPSGSKLFQGFRVPGSEFLAGTGKQFTAHLNTKEISQLAAHSDEKVPLYSKTSLFSCRALQKVKKCVVLPGTRRSPCHALQAHIGNRLTKLIHLLKSQKNFCAQFWFPEKFQDLTTRKSVMNDQPWPHKGTPWTPTLLTKSAHSKTNKKRQNNKKKR